MKIGRIGTLAAALTLGALVVSGGAGCSNPQEVAALREQSLATLDELKTGLDVARAEAEAQSAALRERMAELDEQVANLDPDDPETEEVRKEAERAKAKLAALAEKIEKINEEAGKAEAVIVRSRDTIANTFTEAGTIDLSHAPQTGAQWGSMLGLRGAAIGGIVGTVVLGISNVLTGIGFGRKKREAAAANNRAREALVEVKRGAEGVDRFLADVGRESAEGAKLRGAMKSAKHADPTVGVL